METGNHNNSNNNLSATVASATARRVAYDARRKLAMQTMRAMTKSATMTSSVGAAASQNNRQARISSAQSIPQQSNNH